MPDFDYKEPKLSRDKANKKWFVSYSIRYKGEKNYTRIKEYGKLYLGKNLNQIEDLKKREKEFNKVIALLERDLKNGVILRQTETLKAAIEKEVKESSKLTYDTTFKLYCTLKGYDNPIPKRELTAGTIRRYHLNQFRPFLEKKGLLNDVSQITKADIQEFLNFYYLNPDPEVKWSNTSFNNKKTLLSTYFQTLVDEDIIDNNPVSKIKSKSSEITGRFALYTKEERDLLFEYFDKKDVFMAAICRIIYYAYIREAELTRLKVSDFDLEKRVVVIHPMNAKGQKDKLPRWVRMTTQLKEAIEKYLAAFPSEPHWYMFGKRFKPSPYPVSSDWQYRFRVALEKLHEKHPKLFNRKGLSLYGMKHTGVTDFVNDNSHRSSTELLRYIQTQCRHETLETTQTYLKKLEINLAMIDEFTFD